ncbi:DUF4826 family protein [Thalassotalea maritima]|uniref:DUF4826 family protein n=1 Tax=Thalassotalea maritima TaxID=3242416 RepID=UPI0035299035
MTDTTQSPQLTEEQRAEWVREQYQKATRYLAEKGVVTESVAPEDSRYIAPLVAVWRLQTMNKEKVWVISGDVPCDHISASAAADAREALRNFSMKWQLQAESIRQTAKEPAQMQYAHYLISRAEGLYQLFDDERLWQEQ